MKRLLLAIIILLCAFAVSAQGPITYLPLILKGDDMPRVTDAILRLTDGDRTVDILGPGSGWKLAEPGWRPQVAQLKGGGSYADSALAEGRRLVQGEYGNVVETIPLTAEGRNSDAAIQTVREAMQILRQASDYWKEPYEYDEVWIEIRPPCDDCFSGFARVVQGSIPELVDPVRQPFFTYHKRAVMEDLSLVIEREPFWRGVEPGTRIGPLFNLLRNPDFELWTQAPGAVTDVEPDSWDDLETLWITGTNNRQDVAPNSGDHCLRVEVRSSTLTGATKGVTQIADDTRSGQTYTIVAWVRSDGVSNGVGRILVTYSSQLELYRSDDRHGWTRYVGTFTTGTGDVVAVHCEILTTGANTDGTVYFDSVMLLEGDWEQEALDNVLPYMTGSHIVNHWDQPGGAVVEEGDINWVDVWDVPGDVDALVRLEMVNNTVPADADDPAEVFDKVWIGQRRIRNVFLFDNYRDPPGIADAAASSDDRIDIAALNAGWTVVDGTTVDGPATTIHNLGRYRLLSRVYDEKGEGEPTLKMRGRYWIGTAGVGVKELSSVPAEVRAEWTLLDLTPRRSLIWDPSEASDPPGSLGFDVSMMRDTGVEAARLDYSMLLPTDGGVLIAEIDPPVTYGNALIADSTASESISATSVRAGFFRVAAVSGTHLFPFRGRLFILTSSAAGPTTISQFYLGETTTVWTAGANLQPSAMEEYDGRLYFTQYDTAPAVGSELRSSDGVTFSTLEYSGFNSWVFPGLPVDPLCLKSFDGELWIGTNDVGGSVWRWDGAAAVQDYVFEPGIASSLLCHCLEVYNNRLYAGVQYTNNWVRVYEYEPGVGWSQSFDTADVNDDGLNFNCLQTFNGKLYLGTGTQGRVWAYDGNTWDLVLDSDVFTYVRVLHVFDDRLYLGSNAAGAATPLFVTDDGETWEEVYDPGEFGYGGMATFNGQLFCSTTIAGVSGVYTLSESDNQYKVTDFEGGAFKCPNRDLPDRPKRHRYFFAWNREGFINDIDDKALIGIGFVPRYLSLRGRD